MTRALRSWSLELKSGEHEEIDYKIENSSESHGIVGYGYGCGCVDMGGDVYPEIALFPTTRYAFARAFVAGVRVSLLILAHKFSFLPRGIGDVWRCFLTHH